MVDKEFIIGVADRIALPRDDAKPLSHACRRVRARVAQRTGLDAMDAGTGALAVLATIREAVIPGEF